MTAHPHPPLGPLSVQSTDGILRLPGPHSPTIEIGGLPYNIGGLTHHMLTQLQGQRVHAHLTHDRSTLISIHAQGVQCPLLPTNAQHVPTPASTPATPTPPPSPAASAASASIPTQGAQAVFLIPHISAPDQPATENTPTPTPPSTPDAS